MQERLGQSSITVTLDVYSHLTRGMHGDAANLVGGLIAGTSLGSRLADAGRGGRE